MKVIDFHCDALYEARKATRKGTPLCFEKNDNQIDLQKLAKGDYLLQCFAAFVYMENNQDPLLYALEEIDEFYRMLAEYPDQIAQVKSWADLEANRAAGKISAMLTIEDGGCCQGSLAALRQFHRLGVRMMTLTWNADNELGSGVKGSGGGLTAFGREAVRLMEELGMTKTMVYLNEVIQDAYIYLNDIKWGGSQEIQMGVGQSITLLTPIAVVRYIGALNSDPEALTNNGGNDIIAAVSVMGYDGYYTALAALQAAGSIKGTDVMAALPAVEVDSVSGHIKFDGNGDAIRTSAFVKTVNNETGAWEFVAEQKVD